MNAAMLSAALILGAIGIAAAEQDASTNTIAYWKLNALSSLPEGGVGIFDLATNAGQGVLTGSASVPASVDNLLVGGAIASGMTFASSAPPTGMFNNSINTNFNGGSKSWDSGVDVYSGPGGEVYFDPSVYGNEMTPASFTEEVMFKTDYTNDPTLGTVKQTLIWNHQTSAFAELQLNESASSISNDIGSLLFWGYNVSGFPTVRITAAQNGGRRFDDGNWHYAACRFNATTLNMDIIVVNQDGSSYEQSQTLTQALYPGGAGDFIIGNDETASTPFDGQINQVRVSDAFLVNSNLLGAAPLCSAPVINSQPLIATQPANSNMANTNSAPAATNNAYINDLATISVSATGTSPQYQWFLNGTSLGGQTNSSVTLFPVTTNNAGSYTVIVTTPCDGMSQTSSPALLTVTPSIRPVVNIARWSMEVAVTTNIPNNVGVGTFNGITDSDTNDGQGVYTTGTLPGSIDDLITFNGLPNGGPVILTNDVAPTSMFINGNTAGTNSYFAAALTNVDGALFFPQDQYGDEFDFQTSFSIELFFKTLGNQSGAGIMQLIAQGSDAGPFRYGVDVNEAGPGYVTFAITNNGSYQVVSVTNKNYADGNWHYVLAEYDSTGNQIILTVANSDGSGTNATTALPSGFSPLFSQNTGNMFIGRYNYGWNPTGQEGNPPDQPRNFTGEIDEVQVSSGLVTASSGQLGSVPVVVPKITSISVSNGTVTIKFTGSPSDPASAFTLQGSSTVNGTYSALSATITSLGSGNFQATIATSGSTEFYLIEL